MSLSGLDTEFLFALRTNGKKRNQRELNVIYSRLYRLETLSSFKEKQLRALCSLVRYESHDANEILYRKDDQSRCWYILMSGSVFIQGSMFLPYACFGKQFPGTKRRGCQCLVLEPSEMIAIDYPDMALHSSNSNTTRPHALRYSMTNSGSQSTLDSVAEADNSSSEGSPSRQSRSNSLYKSNNGQSLIMTDNESQSSFSKDLDEDDYTEQDLDEDDSISLHSTSSIFIKDLVIEVLKKEIDDRNTDDLEILLEFTKSLRAFSNMTEPTRRALCKVMVFAWVANTNTIVLKDNEQLDSWSVIINGQVLVKDGDKETTLIMGDSFGVQPTLQTQSHKGVMTTISDDCQFLCIAQDEYFDVLHQGKENIHNICNEAGDVVMVKERREFENGTKRGNIVIRGDADSLLNHLLEDNAIDTTYTEDFLLTYRAFANEPLKICNKLLEWFDQLMFRDKVIRIILLWVNNHFNDFECDWRMMALLEEFEEKLDKWDLQGETKLFNIACTAKAKPRIVSISRMSCDVGLGFEIMGGSEHQFPIYISTVVEGSLAERKGVKRGDQLLGVNGQNFDKLSCEKALAILKKNTDLALTLKTNLFAFKEMVADLQNPEGKKQKKSGEKVSQSLRVPRIATSLSATIETENFDGKQKKGGTLGRAASKFKKMFKKDLGFSDFVLKHGGGDSLASLDEVFLTAPTKSWLPGSSATIDGSTTSLRSSAYMSRSNPDLAALELTPLTELPEDVLKIYKADQTFRFIFVSRDTTAGDAVQAACKEFGITEDVSNYSLCRVSVQGEKFVKQSKLPDLLSKLPDIPLGARYYLKQSLNSEQLLPDENIPELLKEANFSFLDLNCFEIALYLTREDYNLFQQTESTNFIDDLFHLQSDLQEFKQFEDLVNRELFWVVTTICEEPNVVLRSKIIKQFVKIAQHCKILKNFNSTFALISGLGYRAVSRMKQSWEKVPAKSVRQFEEMQALMDPSRNMSKYRTLLNEYIDQPPVIPYVPVVKKDLTFLHLGNDTKVENLINFEKMRMIAKEVRNICRLCAPDVAQIIPSAAAAQQRDDKGPIYQTLARRGRRASFNNARRMYEDQMNVRRVKQYMKQMNIITDEDELTELSKMTESASGSGIPKRRHTSAAISSEPSPSRTSKTLPNHGRSSNSVSTGNLTSRNNSEPYLPNVPVVTTAGTKKKVPSSTLPKYSIGGHSPQLISRKLMSLSEESAEDSKNKGKKGKESKRSVSVSSNHDYSPSSSPFMSPKHQHPPKTPAEGNHTIGMENTNRNNNRHSLPAGVVSVPEASSLTSSGSTSSKKLYFPGANSGPSSCRSSIASASSLGTVSSSNPSLSSLGGNNSSPSSSSPVPWGSNGSLSNASTSSPRLHHSQVKPSSSPVRSSSGSSADTVVPTSHRHSHHERPIIKQTRNGRSSSFGGGSIVMAPGSDRRFSQMSGSSSSPTLNANAPQSALILPNHPQIPRTPSIDSGVLSAGSMSTDSARFNIADENEILARSFPHQNISPNQSQHHRHHEMRGSEGQVSHRNVRRSQETSDHPSASRVPLPPPPPNRERGENNEQEKVEQTFLSGFRGQGDPPRLETKDPFPVNTPLLGATQVDRGEFSRDNVLYQGQAPHGVVAYPTRQVAARSMMGKSGVKGIHEFLVCERHSHYYRANVNNSNNNVSNSYSPVVQSNYMKMLSPASPDVTLEEQLVLELQKQRLNGHTLKRQSTLGYENQPNLADFKQQDHIQPEWSSRVDHVTNSGVSAVPLTSPNPHMHTQKSFEQISCISPVGGNASTSPGRLLSTSAQSQNNVHNGSGFQNNFPNHKYQASSPLVAGVPVHNPTSVLSGINRPKNLSLSEHSTIHVNSKSWEYETSGAVQGKALVQPEMLNRTYNGVPMSPCDHQQKIQMSGCVGHPVNGVAEHRYRQVACDVTDGKSTQLQNGAAHQHIGPLAYTSPQNRHAAAVDVPAGYVLVQQTHYQQVQQTTEQWQRGHVRRKTSQEWSETDLDGEKQQGTTKGWNSSPSPAATSISSNLTSHNEPLSPLNFKSHHHRGNSDPTSAVSREKPPAPAPPKRKSSIGRPQQLRLNSTSSTSPPLSPSQDFASDDYDNDVNTNSCETVFRGGIANGHIAHQHNSTFSAGPTPEQSNNHDRRSLPTYTEAVNQISSKQTPLFSNSYLPFSMDSHESQEQVSQV